MGAFSSAAKNSLDLCVYMYMKVCCPNYMSEPSVFLCIKALAVRIVMGSSISPQWAMILCVAMTIVRFIAVCVCVCVCVCAHVCMCVYHSVLLVIISCSFIRALCLIYLCWFD